MIPLLAAATLGAQLYAVHCSSCHGADLHGSVNGPSLAGAGPIDVDFWVRSGRMPLAVSGEEPQRAAPQFTDTEIRALVDEVSRRAGGTQRAIPLVATTGDERRGREVYETNCEHCHGATGDGGVLPGGRFAPGLHDVPLNELAEAVRIGPDWMPAFSQRQLPDAELQALVTFVNRQIQAHPTPHGGFDLGSTGPVEEGLFAILAGVAPLVLLMRALGTDRRPPRDDV